MAHLLFEHQDDQGESRCEGYAKQLGLDLERFRADLRSDQTTRALSRDRADAERAGLAATPFVLIDGREFDTTYFQLGPDLDEWIRTELRSRACGC